MLFPELDQLTPQQLQNSFTDRKSLQRHGDESALWLDEVATLIAKSGAEGIHFLLSCIPKADECLLRSILVGLSSIRIKISVHLRNELWTVGRTLLSDPRPTIISEAVDLLNLLGCTAVRLEVLKLKDHASPYVVGSVLRYMAHHFPEKALPLLEEALSSKEPIVRQNAIDELDELNCVQSLPTIKRLTRDKDRNVRQAARTAVKNLEEAGQNR